MVSVVSLAGNRVEIEAVGIIGQGCVNDAALEWHGDRLAGFKGLPERVVVKVLEA